MISAEFCRNLHFSDSIACLQTEIGLLLPPSLEYLRKISVISLLSICSYCLYFKFHYWPLEGDNKKFFLSKCNLDVGSVHTKPYF